MKVDSRGQAFPNLSSTPDPISSWQGGAWKILAFACYAALNGIARYLSGGAQTSPASPLSVYMIVFFQDFFALVLLAPWIIKQLYQWHRLQLGGRILPRFLPLHLFRVLTSALGIIFWYLTLFYIPQAEAVALSIIGPIMGVVGASLFLKEQLKGIRLLTLVLSFIGTVVVLQPGSAFLANQGNQKGLICVFLGSLSFALAKLATRRLAQQGESPQLLTAYLLFFIVPVSLIPALFNWAAPAVEHLPWLVGAGALVAGAIYCVSMALAKAQVTFLTPFDFFQFILNVAVGYIAFTELPAAWAIWLFLGLVLFSLSSIWTKPWRSLSSS